VNHRGIGYVDRRKQNREVRDLDQNLKEVQGTKAMMKSGGRYRSKRADLGILVPAEYKSVGLFRIPNTYDGTKSNTGQRQL
jgi:hypothetical protein